MKIEVLGPGCAKCDKLYAEVEKAVAEAGVDAELCKVKKIDEIVGYGVLLTPAIVIDGEVKSSGRVVKAKKIAGWINDSAKGDAK